MIWCSVYDVLGCFFIWGIFFGEIYFRAIGWAIFLRFCEVYFDFIKVLNYGLSCLC